MNNAFTFRLVLVNVFLLFLLLNTPAASGAYDSSATPIIRDLISLFKENAFKNKMDENELTSLEEGDLMHELFKIQKTHSPDKFKLKGIGPVAIAYRHKMVGEAIVEKNYSLHIFSRSDLRHIHSKEYWRKDHPSELPNNIISRNLAEKIAGGHVKFSQLYYISDVSDIFHIRPTPKEPCWVVYTVQEDGFLHSKIINAVDSTVLGEGVPPPAGPFDEVAVSVSGPQHYTCNNDWWYDFYNNAKYWFNEMGHWVVKRPDLPSNLPLDDNTMKLHLQDNKYDLFYEIAHGGPTSFWPNCLNNSITSSEVQSWIQSNPPMPFTFLASCEALCSTGPGTFANAFTKGQATNTAVVGYCGMGSGLCGAMCWPYALEWQDHFFNAMSQGGSMFLCYIFANIFTPWCDDFNCMRLHGDSNFSGPYNR